MLRSHSDEFCQDQNGIICRKSILNQTFYFGIVPLARPAVFSCILTTPHSRRPGLLDRNAPLRHEKRAAVTRLSLIIFILLFRYSSIASLAISNLYIYTIGRNSRLPSRICLYLFFSRSKRLVILPPYRTTQKPISTKESSPTFELLCNCHSCSPNLIVPETYLSSLSSFPS